MKRSVRFPDELARRIEAAADEQNRSFSYLVVKACESVFRQSGSSGSVLPGEVLEVEHFPPSESEVEAAVAKKRAAERPTRAHKKPSLRDTWAR